MPVSILLVFFVSFFLTLVEASSNYDTTNSVDVNILKQALTKQKPLSSYTQTHEQVNMSAIQDTYTSDHHHDITYQRLYSPLSDTTANNDTIYHNAVHSVNSESISTPFIPQPLTQHTITDTPRSFDDIANDSHHRSFNPKEAVKVTSLQLFYQNTLPLNQE
ncbi:MAG: hypothetical protein CMP21_01920 [Rickettsiales bacterium]|nr:hypothetical protein [Rickettsiales bacterium]|tara:strand:+ start:333 stop:818 length:486 start_codon:yes stop_codon:yes gene_type:complete